MGGGGGGEEETGVSVDVIGSARLLIATAGLLNKLMHNMASPFNNAVMPHHQQLVADKYQSFMSNGPALPLKNNDFTAAKSATPTSNYKSNTAAAAAAAAATTATATTTATAAATEVNQPAVKRVNLIDLSNWIKADGLDVVRTSPYQICTQNTA